MKKTRLVGLICFWVLLLGMLLSLSVGAQTASGPERQKIEALIKRVDGLKDAKFIRNGTEYDVSTAVRFLRGKWKANDNAVKTAREFVDKVATASGTSGKAYHIRFEDGREITSRDFLLAELKKLEV